MATMPDTGWRLPPADIVKILDTPPTPLTSIAPDRRSLLLVEYEGYPPLSLLAKPFLKLAGLRIDPTLPGTQRTTRFTGLVLADIASGLHRRVTGLPDGATLSTPVWAVNGRRFAFLRDLPEGGIELWIGEVESATCRPLPRLRIADMLAAPVQWMDDSQHLLVTLLPRRAGPAPPAAMVPEGPVVQEASGKQSQAATYQDLLASPHDERLFAHYATIQLARVDTETGRARRIGEPALFASARLSPDEKWLLTICLQAPFSYRVPYTLFSRRIEIRRAATGRVVRTIADLPVSDEVPRQGVPTGPRSALWQENASGAATLLWVEALDGGDPLKKVPHRDRLMSLAAPFVGAPREALPIVHRFAGTDWCDRPDEILLTEYDRDRRWRTTHHLFLSAPTQSQALFDLSVNDAYGDPGQPVYVTRPSGARTLRQEGDWAFFAGRGATPDGERPFLDRINLLTSEKQRLFQSDDARYDSFVAFVEGGLLLSRQSPTEPPNLFVRADDGSLRALTAFPDPHPQITGLKKELVKYTRPDGVPLSGMLYLPPEREPGKRLPLLLWAYPEEYSDAATAGQVRGSAHTFTRLAGTSPIWFVTQGYAVLNDASMPVVGDPETMNDTFAEQIVGAARAAIDELDRRGLIDPKRVVVAGHSYGAFMTANLLAHAPGLFTAGIARSGAYNRTLTPFGFQSERRSYWEAPEVYHRLSPFTHAQKIKDPILLTHGQADNNPGTHTLQSERFYQALLAHGATARLVLLPHESHGYRARESVLHVLWEMFTWADTHTNPL